MDDPKVRDMLMGLEDDKDIEFDQFKVSFIFASCAHKIRSMKESLV